jgi:hypothetical protein
VPANAVSKKFAQMDPTTAYAYFMQTYDGKPNQMSKKGETDINILGCCLLCLLQSHFSWKYLSSCLILFFLLSTLQHDKNLRDQIQGF